MISPSLRARSVFEIIDASVQLLRQHYAGFVLLSLIAILPLMLTKWLTGWYEAAANPMAMLQLMSGFSGGMFIFLAYLWYVLFGTAIYVGASDAYLEGSVVPGRAIRIVAQRFLSIVVAEIGMAIMLVLGFLLFIIPGVYLALRFFAVLPAITIDHASIDEAFARSGVLSQASKGRIFGALLLTFVIVWVVVAGLGILIGLVGVPPVAREVVSDALVALVMPLFSIVVTLLYYDQRIRKEGFDLEVMARQLQPAATPAAS